MRQEYRANKQRQAPHHSSQVSQISQGSAYPHHHQHYQQPVHYIGQASQYQPPVPGTVYQYPLPPSLSAASVPLPPPPHNVGQVSNDQRSRGHSIMGGRNEQAQARGNVISKRRVAKAHAVHEPPENMIAVNEADSNADMCCLGQNFIPLSYTNRSADVYPYNDSYEPLENVPIITGATAYDHPNGDTYILIFNEALYYGTSMKHSLINPNQIRFNGLDFCDNPMRDENLCIEIDEGLFIDLVAIYFKGTHKNRIAYLSTI